MGSVDNLYHCPLFSRVWEYKAAPNQEIEVFAEGMIVLRDSAIPCDSRH